MPDKEEADLGSAPAGERRRSPAGAIGAAFYELPNEVGIFGPDDRLIMASRKLLESCRLEDGGGVSLDEMLRRLAANCVTVNGKRSTESDSPTSAVVERLRRSEESPVELELKDGGLRLLTVSSTPQGGQVLQCTDITAYRKAAESERYSSEMIRRVLEACPFALVMARLSDLRILYESPANNEMFGEEEDTKAEYIGVYDVDPSERREYLRRLERDGYVNDFEIRFRDLSGTEFVSALSARLIDFEGEKVIVSGAVDLTERRAVEEELARQREALFQSEKLSALGELLAGVSHELNNPLSVLVGHSQLLRETVADPGIAARVEKIGLAADRCARIVKSFLAMARRQPTQCQAVDLNEIVQSALEVTSYSLRAASIDVELRMAEDLPPVSGDPDQLGQVVTNLVINAQHALDEIDGSRLLRVETFFDAPQGEAVIRVQDNGAGIPEEVRSRIFESFFTTKERGMGTGIGLALCHRIVETHDGTISLESPPGRGTAFAVRLPVMAPSASAPVSDSMKAEGPEGLRILVVDDEPDVAGLMQEILEVDGHHCEVAHSGREALRMLREGAFDVVLSDIRMPEKGGQSLYRAVSQDFPHLLARFGFVTGDTLSQKSRALLSETRCPYIEKPITPNDVRDLIKRILERR